MGSFSLGGPDRAGRPMGRRGGRGGGTSREKMVDDRLRQLQLNVHARWCEGRAVHCPLAAGIRVVCGDRSRRNKGGPDREGDAFRVTAGWTQKHRDPSGRSGRQSSGLGLRWLRWMAMWEPARWDGRDGMGRVEVGAV